MVLVVEGEDDFLYYLHYLMEYYFVLFVNDAEMIASFFFLVYKIKLN